MKVTLTQFHDQVRLKGWIFIRLETSDICTQIRTSACFDPYREIYTWLGQIRDSQLPAKIIIDEEGKGVELIVEKVDDKLVYFRMEPWHCDSNDSTRLGIKLQKEKLVQVFCDGIIEFLEGEYISSEWSLMDHLSHINWRTLLTPGSFPAQNWKMRLAMYDESFGRASGTGCKRVESNLTTEQQWLLVLHDALLRIASLASENRKAKAYNLVSFYQNLLIDFALNEFESGWYEKQQAKIDWELSNLRSFHQERKQRTLESKARLSTLKLGQLIDGRVIFLKEYGAAVDIGGYLALLHISAISQAPIEHPTQVFQNDDWVRAIIIWMDVEKGRVSISTSDLEPNPGDMLRDRFFVYKKAEEMADRYRQHVLSRLRDDK